jgi:putative acetyltransferase
MSEATFELRLARSPDDAAIAAIIRTVMPAFGACGSGFALDDPEVDAMSAAYRRSRAAYFVVESAGQIVGGAGIAPLDGGAFRTCELRKMYFLPQARGRGVGARLLARCLAVARGFGYGACYLETLTGMDDAQKLYRRAGFRPLPGPLGATGHHGCDRHYLLEFP